jgi:hypothetical protein
MTKLFEALEVVLQLLARRKQPALLPQVRMNVETRTSRNLSDVRLGRILTLADGLFRASWHTPSQSVELQQRISGELRPPSVEELQTRCLTFAAKLEQLGAWTVPVQDLPQAPLRVRPKPEVQRRSEEEVLHPTALSPSAVWGAGIDRLEALRARVRAKHAVRSSETVGALADARRELAVCEDAVALHAIVASLFDKNEQQVDAGRLFAGALTTSACRGKATASEGEVIAALSSQSSMQVRSEHQVELSGIRAALTFLEAHSDGWFNTKDGVFNVRMRFLHRLPDGSSASAKQALLVERHHLQRRLADLELSFAATPPPADPIVEQATVPKATAPTVTPPTRSVGEQAVAAKATSLLTKERKAELSGLKVTELKHMCRDLSLQGNGNKAELVSRLAKYEAKQRRATRIEE